ncbi:type II toxin-antitoxin system VapC family toxin [Nitrolancea hollandica]|uniref:PilT protein domain protein n=1 Tax=Nitrolancea hollandica Lb TaxID=1129897 RepID=I4EL70_9BACT
MLDRLREAGLAISLITYGAIYEGIYYGGQRQQSERGFTAFLGVIPVLPLNRSIMRHFACIRGELRQRDLIITDPDLLIAATAIDHNLTLVTRNRRDVDRIPELSLFQNA